MAPALCVFVAHALMRAAFTLVSTHERFHQPLEQRPSGAVSSHPSKNIRS